MQCTSLGTTRPARHLSGGRRLGNSQTESGGGTVNTEPPGAANQCTSLSRRRRALHPLSAQLGWLGIDSAPQWPLESRQVMRRRSGALTRHSFATSVATTQPSGDALHNSARTQCILRITSFHHIPARCQNRLVEHVKKDRSSLDRTPDYRP